MHSRVAATQFKSLYHLLHWFFWGPEGLRMFWSVLLFILAFYISNTLIAAGIHRLPWIQYADALSAGSQMVEESSNVTALLIAMKVVSMVEGRHISSYNLSRFRLATHLCFGLVVGFVALSALVGSLAAGGWLRVGVTDLSGEALLGSALWWGCSFLMLAIFEEGAFRGFGLFTLGRGLNFWTALGAVTAVCAFLTYTRVQSAARGVYLAAILGFLSCLVSLRLTSCRSRGFWYATWVTSTFFAFVHINSPAESWVGITAAALIGVVFCISIRITGSAWWAIGCHAGWDWAQTFFYGTSDSGFSPHGSYLISAAADDSLYSGGKVGPEGSVLVFGSILLLLASLLLFKWLCGSNTLLKRSDIPPS